MALFKRKKIMADAGTQPLEDAKQDEQVPSDLQEVSVDRAAYNCDQCKGDGLIYHEGAKRHERCPQCGGTGKVN